MQMTLKTKVMQSRWFHSIDFGEFASAGRFRPGQPQNITLFGFMDLIKHISLEGADVLDVGTVDGLASFGMKAKGARHVVATDSVAHKTFRLGCDALGLEIEYHPNTQLKDFPEKFARGSFDVVLCAGVIYHMLNPVSAFLQCRKIIKEGGLLFMETPYYAQEERACIFINSETEMVKEVNTYSVPTKAAVVGLMKLAGFNVLAVRTISGPDRVTVLAQAVPLAEIENRSPLLKRIQEVDTCDFEFKYGDVIPTPASSTLNYSGPRDEQNIDYRTYTPNFPFHPPREKPTLGTTQWTSPSGNH